MLVQPGCMRRPLQHLVQLHEHQRQTRSNDAANATCKRHGHSTFEYFLEMDSLRTSAREALAEAAHITCNLQARGITRLGCIAQR